MGLEGVTSKDQSIIYMTCDTCGKRFYYLIDLINPFKREGDRTIAFFLLHQLICREHRSVREVCEEEIELLGEALHEVLCGGR